MIQSQVALPALSRGWGEALLRAQLKASPADFIVREQLDIEFDGVGEHVYLQIRKCGMNTTDLVQQLQQLFACRDVDIGYCGLKDKHAITDQWVSIRSPRSIDDASLSLSAETEQPDVGSWQLLAAHRHGRKLRMGAHRANHFIVLLSAVEPVVENLDSALLRRLENVSKHGFANYFGPQRFGFNAENLHRAQAHFDNPRRKLSRVKRGMYLSAARSAIFNEVCSARISAGNWQTILPGEPAALDASHSYFVNDGTDLQVATRCISGDIHPTGPMWGRGAALAQSSCAEFEAQTLAAQPKLIGFCRGLEQAGLQHQRRPLRAMPVKLSYTLDTVNQSLTLQFDLAPGVYATSLLAEIMV